MVKMKNAITIRDSTGKEYAVPISERNNIITAIQTRSLQVIVELMPNTDAFGANRVLLQVHHIVSVKYSARSKK